MYDNLKLDTHDEKKIICIKNIIISEDDINIGNPYNSSAIVEVVSGTFCAQSQFEFDIKNFQEFIKELGIMYDKLSGRAELRDVSYGSYLILEITNRGILKVSGLLFGDAKEHSLKFIFETDQTALEQIVVATSKDKD